MLKKYKFIITLEGDSKIDSSELDGHTIVYEGHPAMKLDGFFDSYEEARKNAELTAIYKYIIYPNRLKDYQWSSYDIDDEFGEREYYFSDVDAENAAREFLSMDKYNDIEADDYKIVEIEKKDYHYSPNKTNYKIDFFLMNKKIADTSDGFNDECIFDSIEDAEDFVESIKNSEGNYEFSVYIERGVDYNIDTIKIEKIEVVELIYFGKFPQTHISDSSLISKLNSLSTTNSNGYYEYEGNEYIKINANIDGDTYESYSDGCKLEDGQEEWFKVEPIEWRVLETNGNKLIILSEYLLQAMAFDDSGEDSNDYENSSIRKWLNNNFYNIAFTEEEKIIENELDGSVWLLGLGNVTNTKYGFSSDNYECDEMRKGKSTDFCLATGGSRAGDWWLLTPDPYDSFIECSVCSDGSVNNSDVSWTNSCARPSLIIEIE